MSLLLRAPGRRGTHLPARERVPPLNGVSTVEPAEPPADDDLIDLLARGELEVLGRLVDASNATMLAEVRLDERVRRCVYKPIRGERPLWDFPGGTLGRREVAAYEVSAAAGWRVVPPTLLRDGPHGPGSVQAWVDDGDVGGGVLDVRHPGEVPSGWLTVLQAETYDGSPLVLAHADDPTLASMAVFDVVVNNADRKIGHVLRDPVTGRLLGVDHGLTFNIEHKLRTVLWGWAGAGLAPADLDRLQTLSALLTDAGDAGLAGRLADLLTDEEVESTRRRVERLLSARRHPRPQPGRYPAIPWPPL